MNFYSRLLAICSKKGISITALLKEMGLSTSMGTKWRNGTTPNLETVQNIAKHLNVTVAYLIGETDNPLPPDDDVSMDDISYALFDEVKELSEEQKQEILNFARFMREKRKNEKK